MGGKKGARGIGAIRKKTVNRNGTSYTYWEGRVTVGRDPGTGKQVQRSFTGKTQKEVRQKMQEAAVEVEHGTYQAPLKITVGEWLDDWSRNYQTGTDSNTAHRCQRHLEIHIIPKLGAVKLQALATSQIQTVYNEMAASGLSGGTVQIVHITFQKALNQAVENGLIQRNPAKACKLPKYERPPVTPLEQDDIRRLLAYLDNPDNPESRYSGIIQTSLFTGMREGEVLGLSWDEIDFTAGTIDIRQQLRRDVRTNELCIVPPKGGKTRTICAPRVVLDILRHQQVVQAEMRLAAGELWRDTGLVFTREDGTCISACTIGTNFKKAAAAVGIEHTKFHNLRHTAATMMLQNGDSPKTVQETLGHASAGFTLNVYGHVTKQMRRDSADRMDRLAENL